MFSIFFFSKHYTLNIILQRHLAYEAEFFFLLKDCRIESKICQCFYAGYKILYLILQWKKIPKTSTVLPLKLCPQISTEMAIN